MPPWAPIVSSQASNQVIAFDGGKLLVPDSLYEFACVERQRYVSLCIDAELQRLGIQFHSEVQSQYSALLDRLDENPVFSGRAYAADVAELLVQCDWLRVVAEAECLELRTVPISYSIEDGMWVATFPRPFSRDRGTGLRGVGGGEVRGVLRVWNADEVVAVSNCLLRAYLSDSDFRKSPWTSYELVVIDDPVGRAVTARWWRRHAELKQGRPLSYPTLSSWPGECRSPEQILFDKGWSSEAMEALQRETYDELIGPGERILPPHLINEWDEAESVDNQALFTQLSLAEKAEARKYFAIENEDYDDESHEEEELRRYSEAQRPYIEEF